MDNLLRETGSLQNILASTCCRGALHAQSWASGLCMNTLKLHLMSPQTTARLPGLMKCGLQAAHALEVMCVAAAASEAPSDEEEQPENDEDMARALQAQLNNSRGRATRAAQCADRGGKRSVQGRVAQSQPPRGGPSGPVARAGGHLHLMPGAPAHTRSGRVLPASQAHQAGPDPGGLQ